MVYKFTDTMAALISYAFTLSFILFDRLVAYFLQWRFVTNQCAVPYLYIYIRVDIRTYLLILTLSYTLESHTLKKTLNTDGTHCKYDYILTYTYTFLYTTVTHYLSISVFLFISICLSHFVCLSLSVSHFFS